MTNSVHSYDVLTRKWTRYSLHIFLKFFGFYFRVEMKWDLSFEFFLLIVLVLVCEFCRIRPAGEPPSPRAAHAAAAVGTMVVFQVRFEE